MTTSGNETPLFFHQKNHLFATFLIYAADVGGYGPGFDGILSIYQDFAYGSSKIKDTPRSRKIIEELVDIMEDLEDLKDNEGNVKDEDIPETWNRTIEDLLMELDEFEQK
jgi:hypothetical protein